MCRNSVCERAGEHKHKRPASAATETGLLIARTSFPAARFPGKLFWRACGNAFRESFIVSWKASRESFDLPGKLQRFLESFAGKLRSSGKASAFRGKASRESFDVPESY
jgi:hypothetical protein